MNALVTQAQARDEIRQMMGKNTLIGITGNPQDAGKPAPGTPWPSNFEINGALDLATTEINKKCGYHGNPTLSVVLQPQTALGPQVVGLRGSFATAKTPAGFISQVRRISYTLGSNPPVRVWPTSREWLDRNEVGWDQYAPSLPQYFFVEFDAINLVAASSQQITLNMIAGTAPIGFISDNDTLDQVPVDFQSCWLYYAVWELARRRTQDVEMTELALTYGMGTPESPGMYAVAVAEFAADVNQTVNVEEQPSFGNPRNRQSYGTFRILR